MSISFLDASKIISEKNDFEIIEYTLASSVQTEKLDIFIKANSILNEFNSQYTTLPFNTLPQYISNSKNTNDPHVFILFPWDLIPECDWRTGVSSTELTLEKATKQIEIVIKLLKKFIDAIILYIPAKSLPVTSNFKLNQQIHLRISKSLLEVNSIALTPEVFSLSSYLSTGCPFSSKKLDSISSTIILALTHKGQPSKKLLITDLDNVMWRGVIGEDGIENIHCDLEGAGYIHNIYQSYLLKLKSQGILLAAVSKNDNDLALEPFTSGKTLLKQDDFVTIIASYHAKSSQISSLIKELNIAEDSVVFIDDNSIELEEVKTALNLISCLLFPSIVENFPLLISEIEKLFNITNITNDDKSRTELYRTRRLSNTSNETKSSDLSEYLYSLNMEISIEKGNIENSERSLQLFNKTNQFNLNGERISEQELQNELISGAKLYQFHLKDKNGKHGQIACILISNNNIIDYFVMSCRVFQRKIEYAILLWIINELKVSTLILNHKITKRNTPFQLFLKDTCLQIQSNDSVTLDTELFTNNHSDVLKLFSKIIIS